MKFKILIVTALVCAVAAGSQVTLRGQSQRTTKDGVYTAEQANRGYAIVTQVGCDRCHNDSLRGGLEETPALIGTEFLGSWSGRTLKDLNFQISTMPADGSFKISPAGDVDVMAYLLQANGYPAGNSELVPDPEALNGIKIVLP